MPRNTVFFEHVCLQPSEELPRRVITSAPRPGREVVREAATFTISLLAHACTHCQGSFSARAEGVDVGADRPDHSRPFDLETITRFDRRTHKVIVVEKD